MIYVVLTTTDLPVSKIIRFFTRSQASHAIFVFDGIGGKWVLEASLYGIRTIPYTRFCLTEKIVKVIPIKELNSEDLAGALQKVGERYDFGGLFGALFVVMGRWFKKKIKNPLQSPNALFCSELIALTLKEKGRPGFEDIDPENVTPDDLASLLA